MNEMDFEGGSNAHPTDDGLIECAPWDLQVDPTLIPSLPSLPNLPSSDPNSLNGPQIVKIAGFDNALVALTDHGHVLLYDLLGEASGGQWKYVSMTSIMYEVVLIYYLP